MVLLFIVFGQGLNAQTINAVADDSLAFKTYKLVTKKDSTQKKYNPAIAIRRSAILPGWGQFTNKKYWKIPLVYGALGTTGYLFTRNLKQYREAKQAFILATDGDPTNDNQIKEPYYTVLNQPDRIRVFRNQVRQNVDYSVLFFIIFWGLNVADAAVDANLKTFDVSDDISLQIKPGYSPLAQTNGLSLVMHIGKRK
ncbi:DUF5683 domain-containing protein [Ferruginibacter yonginensis]|uniref:DUF5683 domain-containing protein n=1 Tax=Ferruginibacter yonginensis TaxID=1310416 RepID=A0ABV8QU63_9BACT